MKTCPYCAEEIQDAAIVCKHCQRSLTDAAPGPVEPTKAATPPSPGKVGGLVALGLIWLFVSMLRWCAVPGARTNTPKAPASAVSGPSAVAPATEAVPSYDLELLASRGYSIGGHYIVEGQVKNVSGEPIKSVTAVTTWYTASSEFVGSDKALVDYDPLLPGQTSPFKTFTRGNPEMQRFRVEFKRLMGGTLRVNDRSEEKPGQKAK